jgi:hypothetical protein
MISPAAEQSPIFPKVEGNCLYAWNGKIAGFGHPEPSDLDAMAGDELFAHCRKQTIYYPGCQALLAVGTLSECASQIFFRNGFQWDSPDPDFSGWTLLQGHRVFPPI